MNVILNDSKREYYKTPIERLFQLCPETMARKIPEANVQQAHVYLNARAASYDHTRMLSVGCFEDTAFEALSKEGRDIVGIDPQVNMGLQDFFHMNYGVNEYGIIISTSVIEHVEDDELFIDQICKLLARGGVAFLTCDFRDDYKPGDPKPGEDFRLYTEYDLVERLNNVLEKNDCKMIGERDYSGPPDFWYGVYNYSFATYTFQKK